MQKITHPNCTKKEKIAFYVPAMPVGRGILPVDAINEHGMTIAMGNRVECVSCGEKLSLDEINEYYDVETP